MEAALRYCTELEWPVMPVYSVHAEDWGDTNHVPPDICDLDNDTSDPDQKLPYDLDPPNGRNQGAAPDAGSYEIPD